MVPRRRRGVWLRGACVALCVVMAACAPHFEKPAVTVEKIDYRGGNLLQQDFAVRFNIHNPNTRALPVAGLDAELSVDGDRIAAGAADRPFVVPALGDGQFDMSIHVDMAAGLLKLLAHRDELPYALTGKVRIDLPLLRSMPFQSTGSIKLNN